MCRPQMVLKRGGLTHEMVGDILMCWSMLRRLASHLTLPDIALGTFVAALCTSPGSALQKKSTAAGNGAEAGESESDDVEVEVGGAAADEGRELSVRATYQDDVFISLLYELCGELRRREVLVPSSGALNVYTWPEALRTYLYWMAHHVYLVSVGCDRDTQNERADWQDGTEEGRQRLAAMEEELQGKSDELLRVVTQLQTHDYSTLSLSDRLLVLSTLCNQLLHTAKFQQQVEIEAKRADQVRFSLAEIMNAISEEEKFSASALHVQAPTLPPAAPLAAHLDDDARARVQEERAQLEEERAAKHERHRTDAALHRAVNVKRIVRPSKALLHADGTKLQQGVELKGTEVQVNGLANGHELPPGVRRCRGVIFRTLMPGWHEVRKIIAPGEHGAAAGWPGVQASKAAAAATAAAGGGEDKDKAADDKREAALVDAALVHNEDLRKLHQLKVMTAKL